MSDVYLFEGALDPYDVILRPIPPIPPVPPKYNLTIPIRYIKPIVLINRNGERVGYRTTYTPYQIERPIQPETG